MMMAGLAGWLALVPLAIIAVMGVAGFVLQRRMMQASLDNQADMSIQHAMLVEAIGGAETVKSCAAEGQVPGQWRRMVDTRARTQAARRRTGAAANKPATPGQPVTGLALVAGAFYLCDSGQSPTGSCHLMAPLAGGLSAGRRVR